MEIAVIVFVGLLGILSTFGVYFLVDLGLSIYFDSKRRKSK